MATQAQRAAYWYSVAAADLWAGRTWGYGWRTKRPPTGISTSARAEQGRGAPTMRRTIVTALIAASAFAAGIGVTQATNAPAPVVAPPVGPDACPDVPDWNVWLIAVPEDKAPGEMPDAAFVRVMVTDEAGVVNAAWERCILGNLPDVIDRGRRIEQRFPWIGHGAAGGDWYTPNSAARWFAVMPQNKD